MRTATILAFLSFSIITEAQISASKQKALNRYADYANQSADEITAVVKSIIDYYPSLNRKSSWPSANYVCPIQPDDYYYNKAEAESKIIEASLSSGLNKNLIALRNISKKIEERCKALDTYHKLEDYKKDNYDNAEKIILELKIAVSEYKKEHGNFQSQLQKINEKLPLASGGNNCRQADIQMQKSLIHESELLDRWSYNLKENIHTGWPDDLLPQNILETEDLLKSLEKKSPALKYPASSMWSQFKESLSSVLEVKRRGLDEYNFEAKKSDKHSNDVYLELINYYNGTLVADYNTFIQFSERDGYFGIKAIKYVPGFDIRTESKEIIVFIKPFKDIEISPLKISDQKTAISKDAFEALSNYVEFINETWRQLNYMGSVLENFSSSASYYKNLESYDKRGPMHFDFADYTIPLSSYQKLKMSSGNLPSNILKPLNEQAEVLLNILKEVDDQSASLENEVKEKKYEKDHLEKVFQILERQSELFKIWDEKKEFLYNELRLVYNSYPSENPTNSWQISGKALRDLSDLDHNALFQTKAFYKGDSTVKISTHQIDQKLRDVISKEYDHMKGIQKIGRSNGLCPYTPYEDIPETSKQFSEQLQNLKPPKNYSRYSHPYHSLVYLYNDIVDDYNKFCELSASVPHLKTIKQPELFFIKYPETNINIQLQKGRNQNQVTENNQSEKNRQNESRLTSENSANTEKNFPMIHDTVFIEKRDTIYLADPKEDLRSMEGYATNNMILLLDVSGSMDQPEKLPLLKASFLDLLSMMRKEDIISIIAFSAKPKILLKPTSFKEEDKIKKAINNLSSSGKTDGNAGMKAAYKLADENYIRGGSNRIILATDGEFVLNDETRQLIESFSSNDIFLSVFNFGKGMGSSKSLQQLANLGKGNYESISKENVNLKLIREVKAKKKK